MALEYCCTRTLLPLIICLIKLSPSRADKVGVRYMSDPPDINFFYKLQIEYVCAYMCVCV